MARFYSISGYLVRKEDVPQAYELIDLVNEGDKNKDHEKKDLIPKLDEWILEQKLQEYAKSTLNQYRANVQKFIDWLPDNEDIDKETMLRYKMHLGEIAGSTNSINVWIVEINKFLKWLDLKDLTIKKSRCSQNRAMRRFFQSQIIKGF